MLKNYFEKILINYKTARNENFTQHPMAKLLRVDFPKYLEEFIGNSSKYKFSGSAGRGTWTHCPWVAILDKSITETAQSGFFPMYLFKENMEGFYLSLNQGTDKLKETRKSDARNILRSRAQKFRDELRNLTVIPNDFLESIKLDNSSSSSSRFYEEGNIYAKYYSLKNLPSEEKLESDLKEILNIYDLLIEQNKPLKIVEDEEKIAESQDKFLGIFKDLADKAVNGRAGFQGGQEEVKLYWSSKLKIWLGSRKIENSRYWNGFGIDEPEEVQAEPSPAR